MIDLFAGCGGLSLGLRWAGWDAVCAVESSPIAAETYFANLVSSRKNHAVDYTEHLEKSVDDQIRAGLLVGDVRTFANRIDITRELLNGRELALLAGGPPCQGFSLAGKRSSGDPRNSLVWDFLEIAELLSPLAVLMENVDAIQSPFQRGKRTSVLDDLEKRLKSTSLSHGGYAIVRLSLRADHFGVPQRRKRIFLVGVRKDIARSIGIPDLDCWDSDQTNQRLTASLFAPGLATTPAPTASEALWDILGAGYAALDSAPSEMAREYALRARGGNGRENMVPKARNSAGPQNHEFRSHEDRTRTRFSLLRLFREHGIRNQVFGLAANGLDGIEKQLKPLESLLPMEFPLGKTATLQQLVDLVRSVSSLKQSQRALAADDPSPTVTTLPDDLCHYAVDRTLTVREMARLQSFPDSFIFRGKVTTGGKMRRVEVPQYSQVGNAVPPLLAEAIGVRLKDRLSCWLLTTPCSRSENDSLQ